MPAHHDGSRLPGALAKDPRDAPRNGVPLGKPYRWRAAGDPREAEVQRQLADLRWRLEHGDGPPAVDVPGQGGYGDGHPGRAPAPHPVDVPGQVCSGEGSPGRAPAPPPPRPRIVPCSASGRRRPQPGIVPPSLAARLAAWHVPVPVDRCRRCGYLTTKCSCPKRGRR